MTIRNILTRLVTSFPSYGKKINNTRILYPQSINQVPVTYFTDSFNRYKKSRLCTSENCNPISMNDSSWATTEMYTFKNRLHFKNAFKNAFKITMLQWQHDPEFNLESFKKGTKQAMSVITKSLHENKNTKSYLSINASEELERISHNWSSSIRKNIALEPNQILQIFIVEVKGIKLTEGVVYQINTYGLGYKPFHGSFLQILLQAKFERLYSENIIPEWNVSQFNILNMNRITT